VYFNVRGEEARECILVIVGVTEQGTKEFVAIEDGFRESEQSWLEVLTGLKHQGLKVGPKLAIGDGALGWCKALAKVYGQTRHQRCWVHKTVTVLNKLPKSLQQKAKSGLHQIWMAESRGQAEKAFDTFIETYRDKYPKAAQCLEKDREQLLAFYDFPAVHWQHIRTTNPIESTFATVRLRTDKIRGCVSRQSLLAMVYQLGQSAAKRWRRLRGFEHLAEVIAGVKFKDGVRVASEETNRIAA
jgi:transposase-like protein